MSYVRTRGRDRVLALDFFSLGNETFYIFGRLSLDRIFPKTPPLFGRWQPSRSENTKKTIAEKRKRSHFLLCQLDALYNTLCHDRRDIFEDRVYSPVPPPPPLLSRLGWRPLATTL